MSSVTHFKGWAKPGPQAPGGIEPEPGETLDALSGHFRIFQLKEGHRFSTDDLLVAWYGTLVCPSATRVLDLGSGIGSVGQVAAWRLTGARFVTIEAQEISVPLARRSVEYNGIGHRYEIRQGDFRSAGVLSDGEKFDLILGSPPYFPEGTGPISDHPQKVACRFELRGDVTDYCRVAAAHLGLGGVFAGVFPAAQSERLLRGVKQSDGVLLRYREIVFKEGEPPLLWVFAMMRESDLPAGFGETPWKEPPLVIRLKDGSVSPEYQRVKLSIGFPP